MSNTDSLCEIAETVKDARQFALLGNYERSIVFFKGIIRDINKNLQNYDEKKIKASRADLQAYRAQIDKELKQIEELESSVTAFRNLLTPSAHTPSAYNYNNHNNNFNFNGAYNMGGGGGGGNGGGMNYGHNQYQNDPYKNNEPDFDPDVWPAPPAKNPGRNGGYQQNYSPKHYKGKQANGNDIKPGANNNNGLNKQINKGKLSFPDIFYRRVIF
jgi:hypothetical protein